MIYPTRYLIVFLEAELAGAGTSITSDGLDVDYAVLRPQVNLAHYFRPF